MSAPRPRRTKVAATPTLPPTPLEQFIAADNARQRKTPKTEYQKLSERVKREKLEQDFLRSLVGIPLPAPEPQQRLITGTRYRGDFVWQDVRLVVECDGGQWGRYNPQTGEWEKGKAGGHNSPAGMERDRIRDAKCMLAGWTVLRVTATMIADNTAAYYTEQLYKMLSARKSA